MKLYPDCMPCFLKRILYEIKLVTDDDKLAMKILCEVSRIMEESATPEVNSAELSTVLHKKTYEIMRNNDPYLKMKIQSNTVAKKLVPTAEKFIQKSKDKFRAAVITAIIGNIFDYGITDFKEPDMLIGLFDKMCRDGLGHDDTVKIKKIIRNSHNILFFTDNCGEIVFDKLLLREIRNLNPKIKITLVPKGVPILSDATKDDVIDQKLDTLVDELLPTERFAVGVDLKNMSKSFRHMLDNADLIISKGMANYESFSDFGYRPIAYLMRTKCGPVAKSAKVRTDISAAKLYV